jgi:hypothetical protein
MLNVKLMNDCIKAEIFCVEEGYIVWQSRELHTTISVDSHWITRTIISKSFQQK